MKNKKVILMLLCAFFCTAAFAQSEQGEKTLKRKVAIGRFTNETQYGKGLFYNRENDPMRKQAMDILSSKLASSGKFILLERDDLDVLVEEAGADMQKIGADYIILGSITEFGRKVEGDNKIFSSTKTQTVEAGVSIRLVDVASGLIIYSDEAKGYAETTTKTTMGIGGSAGYDATLSDKAISAALTQLVENVINKCMDNPWRGYLLSCDDDNYVISGGASQGVIPGTKFYLYKKGKVVKNPQNGMNIELPGTKLGELTVIMNTGNTPETEISFCTYSGDSFDKQNLEMYYLMEK
ncbi:MAG: penicillin-binding protein activator LpoB [bacterium]|nr:penicillin-binding protein activator LpoB [Candidatus Limimorpha equi]